MKSYSCSFSLPEKTRIYAIGDIHGYLGELEAMHGLIKQDLEARPIEHTKIVYIGDYIDRGPESAGVIQCLTERELYEPDIEHIYLRGNHENAMMEFIDKPTGPRKDWLEWGGLSALMSYGVQANMAKPLGGQLKEIAAQLREKLPLSHAEFLKNTRLFYVCGGFAFVHAGVRANVALDKQKYQDLIMIRKGFLDYSGVHEHYIVHGHTSVDKIDIRGNRMNIDTGLYYGRHLTAAVIEGNQITHISVPMISKDRVAQDGKAGLKF